MVAETCSRKQCFQCVIQCVKLCDGGGIVLLERYIIVIKDLSYQGT